MEENNNNYCVHCHRLLDDEATWDGYCSEECAERDFLESELGQEYLKLN